MLSTNLTLLLLQPVFVRRPYLICSHVSPGAIGTLRGPLHGGANEAAMDMIEKFKSPEDAKVANGRYA